VPSTGPTTPAPADPPIIRISQTGTDPRQLIIAVGERVTFINNDSQPHDIAGGPDPATPDCRERATPSMDESDQSPKTFSMQGSIRLACFIAIVSLRSARSQSGTCAICGR
jgi:hypothetical protein